jgi:DNA repair exonuclease SbcCD ATPase subunit
VALFYTILGTKAERLTKERQEYLAAKLKHDEAVEAVKDTQQKVERLQQELTEFRDADAEYARLVEEKHRLLVETRDQRAEALLGFAERLADLGADKKELQEAIQAGTAARDALERVRAELRSAENWGTWDMFGGGFLATMAKHSRIDTAKQHAQAAQRLLRKFQEELADAGQRLHVALDIGGFSTFADYFFDGLIADWVVQSKVQNASSACSSALLKVSEALAECQRRLAESEQYLDAVTEQRRQFVEQA